MKQLQISRGPLRRVTGVMAVVAAMSASGSAWACATCGCTLSKDWLGGQALGSAGWSAGLSYDVINQNQFHQGSSNISQGQAEQILNGGSNANPSGNEVETQTLTRTTTLNLDYNTPEWGVSVQLPIIYRYHTTYQVGLGQTASDAGVFQTGNGGAESYNFSQVNSLGDMRVVGRYALAEDGGYGVTFGVKLPTGITTGPFSGAAGGIVDPSLQAGTGSTDILLGAYYTGQKDALGWFTQATWQHALASQAGYTPGDTLNTNLGLRYAGLSDAVTPLVQINYVHRNTDSGFNASHEFDGTPQTGGNLGYLAPGVAATLGNGFRAYAYVQIPIYQNVNGVQLTAKEIFSLGLRKSF